MNATVDVSATTPRGAEARQRYLGQEGAPFFLANWERALFLHYTIAPGVLAPHVPFLLDLRDGQAFVSLVAFTMRRFRFARGGGLAEGLGRAIGDLRFLNVRTYVKHHGEPGIHFLAEWISSGTQTLLGPLLYSLPYRWGRLEYNHRHEVRAVSGRVASRFGREEFVYEARLPHATGARPDWRGCGPDTTDDFLLERYTAFNGRPERGHYFRIWHEPWEQTRAEGIVRDDSLLRANFPWWPRANLVGANYSPGAFGVWMGAPRRVSA
jgi:uncharacterized protein YqjF (DUF2071 family)